MFYEERLIAYSVVKRKADMVDYYTWKADYVHYKRLNPIYGLLYRMNEYYLNELGLRYVSDGNRSYTEHSQVQSFLLEKFKFRKAYATSRAYFRWWFKPVVVGLYLFRGWIRNNALRSFARMYEWSK